jgi:hypothetical protein
MVKFVTEGSEAYAQILPGEEKFFNPKVWGSIVIGVGGGYISTEVSDMFLEVCQEHTLFQVQVGLSSGSGVPIKGMAEPISDYT